MEWLVHVAINQAAGLTFGDDSGQIPSPIISVIVFGEKHESKQVVESATAAFHHSFSVTQHMKRAQFLQQDVKVEVNHYQGLGLRFLLGRVVFSLRKVYSQPRHMVPLSWFPVVKPDAPMVTMGFVQMSIAAFSSADEVPSTFGIQAAQAEEGSSINDRALTLPCAGKVISLYELTVRIHKAEHLREVSGLVSSSVDAYVQVTFYGETVTTKTVRNDKMPVWNQGANITFQMPCWDESVDISLKAAGTGGVNELVIGELQLYTSDLVGKELPPTWYNFYYAPPEESVLAFSSLFSGSSGQVVQSAFAGRLLLSACVERTERPLPKVTPTVTVADPHTTKHNAWIDLYQVSIDGDSQPSDISVTFDIPGHRGVRLDRPVKDARAFYWQGSSGRAEEFELDLPDPRMCYDFFVSVWVKSSGWTTDSWVRYMFCRIPSADVFSMDITPKWYEAKLCSSAQGPKNAGFVLASFVVSPSINRAHRPERHAIRLRKYRFEAMVFQAVNLPFRTGNGQSNPYCVVFFGDALLHTTPIPLTSHPVWKEALMADVELPENEAMRPDILLFLLDHTPEGSEPIAELRYRTNHAGALPSDGGCAEPTWLNLVDSPGGPDVMSAKLLISFQLTPKDRVSGGTYEIEGVDSKIKFYAMGVRLWDSLNFSYDHLDQPRLVVSFGRHPDKLSEPLVEAKTGLGEGFQGDYNWNETVTLNVVLSRDTAQQEFLELRLVSRHPEQKNKWVTIAYGMVGLDAHKPWVSSEERRLLKEAAEEDLSERPNLEEHTQEVVNANFDASFDAADLLGGSPKGRQTMLGRQTMAGRTTAVGGKEREVKKTLETELRLAKAIGWDFQSIAERNVHVLGTLSFANLTEEDQKQGINTVKKGRANVLSVHPGNASRFTAPRFTRTTRTARTTARNTRTSQVVSDEADPDQDVAEAMQKFARQFNWSNEEKKAADTLLFRPDIDGVMESGPLAAASLPYDRVHLYTGTDWGEKQHVGVLKFCCLIVDDQPRHEEEKAFNANIEAIRRMAATGRELEVRAYIVSAADLLPISGSTSDGTFVVSRVEKGSMMTQYTVWDSANLRYNTNHPQFYKCHSFANVHFPGNCTLDVAAREVLAAGVLDAETRDQVIGRTRIDLEDRWFAERYREMVAADIVPIETRPLRRWDSSFAKGHLRIWVDILAFDAARARPIAPLPSTEPVQFHLRVVIWKIKGIDNALADGETPDVYVSGKHVMDDGTELVQRTDTHYRTNDGKCTFNWRLIFELMVPCSDPRLQLRVWNDNLITDDPMAEVTLDLAHDFQLARQTNDAVDLERGIISLTHPSQPGEVRCQLDVEAKLLPLAEAISQPAGAGRDEPNEDPFLDPEDPHLLAHRDYFASFEAVRGLANIGTNLWFAGKWMTFLYGFASVAGGICFSVITIVTLTKA